MIMQGILNQKGGSPPPPSIFLERYDWQLSSKFTAWDELTPATTNDTQVGVVYTSNDPSTKQKTNSDVSTERPQLVIGVNGFSGLYFGTEAPYTSNNASGIRRLAHLDGPSANIDYTAKTIMAMCVVPTNVAKASTYIGMNMDREWTKLLSSSLNSVNGQVGFWCRGIQYSGIQLFPGVLTILQKYTVIFVSGGDGDGNCYIYADGVKHPTSFPLGVISLPPNSSYRDQTEIRAGGSTNGDFIVTRYEFRNGNSLDISDAAMLQLHNDLLSA